VAKERYSDGEIAGALRAAGKIAGEPLSVGKYDKIRSTCAGPSAIRLIQRFGSWSAACEAAGVKSGEAKRTYVRRWERSQIVDLVRQYLRASRKVSFQDFSQWLKKVPNAPSSATCRNVGVSWSSLLESAREDH
jgi:hypothetical protein